MKKLLSILSLGVLLFCSLAPSFTYAVDIDEVSSLLESFLQSTNNEQQENNENIFQQSSNSELQNIEDEAGEDEIEIIGGNNHIIWNKTKGLITVYTGNYSYGITLQDKDLGAQNVGETGLYYQWGNNHGKTEGQELLDTLIERGDYDGKGYDGNITGFINRLNENKDYWEIEDSNNPYESLHNNLWGGGNDNENNNFGYNEERHEATNVSERRGPCPEGYHVPSLGERSKLVQTYFNGINNSEYLTEDNTYNGIYYTTSAEGAKKFINTFKIKFGGQLHIITNTQYVNRTLASSTYYSYLRTSTPKPLNDQYNNLVFNIGISEDFVYTTRNYNRSVGLQVRCFKNEYVPYELKVKFNPNGGAFSGMNKNQIKEYTYTTDGNGIIPIYNIQIPDRESEDISQQSGWMFDGWYTKSGDNNDWGEEFDITSPQTTVVYAKWLPFNDLKLNIGGRDVIIMDRNMGAEGIAEGIYYGDGNHEDYSVIGKYYQWGNNYGFKGDGHISNSGNDLIKNNSQENSPWGPGNYYYSNKFIKRLSDPFRWDYENNLNLWGGDNQKNTDEDRKGPCPIGYHIPDYNEWHGVKDLINIESTNDSNYCPGELNNKAKCFLNKLNLPYAGRLNYWNAVLYFGDGTDYRSSTRGDNSDYGISHGAMAIDIRINGIYGLHTYRTDAHAVRCFKNTEPINNLTIIEGNGEDDIVYPLRWWESITNDYKPEDPTNNGYRFLGWYSGDNEFSFNGTRYYNNVVVGAKWEKKPRYYFNSNGGVFVNGKEENIIKYNEEEFERKVSHTPNVNDDGTTNGSYPGEQNSIDVVSIEGADILEIRVKGYTKCKNGICDYVAVRKGNHPDYNASQYNEDDNDFLGKLFNGQYEIYRNEQENSYTIGFYSSGNKVEGYVMGYFAEIIGIKYTTNEEIIIPIKTGYTFSGWYESGATDPFDFTGTRITQDRTFYAKWIPNTYTIQFNTNGGTGTVEDINVTYGEEIQLPTVSKEGYAFKGWKSEDGTIYNNIIPEGTGATTEDGVTITLTAQWESNGIQPSAGGGQTITPSKSEEKYIEQEHNSADNQDQKITNTTSNSTTTSEVINQQVIKVQERSLTRGEVAIMTNILLEVYPQLVGGKQELDDVTDACSNYADEQNFTKDEKKAITRLCKLSIMGIHNDTNEPLEEFLVNSKSTNDEFSKVINRSIENYNGKDLSTIKDALKKLEGDKENVVFGTVYNVFMSIKSFFN